MSFFDHLEELRWHLVRSLLSIVVLAIAAFISKDIIFNKIILGPSRPEFWTFRQLCYLDQIFSTNILCVEKLPFIIQSRKMTGQFTMHITSSAIVGLILAFPYAFWEIWRFIKPGLYSNEKNLARGATFSVSLLFFLGILFGYFIVVPISINFLANYQIDPSILNEFDIISYVGTVATLVLACGVMFQLPIVVYFTTKAGIVTPELLKTYRRHAIVVILVLSAIITPPDIFSQLLISFPLIILYEVSIVISRMITRRERKKELVKNP